MIAQLINREASLRQAGDVIEERIRQDAKFGEQNHPDGTGLVGSRLQADYSRKECDAATANGTLTFRHILTEEVDEAFAETDEDALAAELLQVAAVALQWREAIQRRQAAREAAAA